MKGLASLIVLLVVALPAMATRQFPPPTFAKTIAEAAGEAIAVSAASAQAYVANAALDRVAVIGEGGQVSYLTVGRNPRYIIALGFGFMTSNAGDGTLSLSRDLATVTTIAVGGSGPLVSNGTGRVFMLRPDGMVAAIDVATFTVRTFDTGLRAPVQLVIGESPSRIVVADASGEIRLFDAFADRLTQTDSWRLPARPGALVWLPGPGRTLYVLLDDPAAPLVQQIDFESRRSEFFGVPGNARGARGARIAGNVFYAGFSNMLVTLDLSVHTQHFTETGDILSIDVEQGGGHVFVLDSNRDLRVIEPRTLREDVVPLPSASTQVRFQRGTCDAYVAGAAVSVVHAPCADAPNPELDLQALWWVFDGRESGWGLNIAHQAGTLFATWFTYNAQGQPTWFVMSNGARVGQSNEYAGDLYRTSGPPFNAPAFDPARVTRTPVGDAHIFVLAAESLHFTATVDGARGDHSLAKQIFASPTPMCDTDVTAGPVPIYQDLWWNPAESGWGLNIAHQGDILFITWFTYDSDGSPTWFVGSDIAKTGNTTYSGTLYKTSGPPMTASPWNAAQVTRTAVGSATLSFGDADHGTFSYAVAGVSGSKTITRQVFATPVTRCR